MTDPTPNLPPPKPPAEPALVAPEPSLVAPPEEPAIVVPGAKAATAAPALVVPAPDAGPPVLVKPRSRRWLKVLLAVVGLAVLACGGGSYLLIRQIMAPTYGPPAATDIDLTLAPGVSVEALPAYFEFTEREFEEFDVAPGGSIVVRDADALYDMVSGDRLIEAPDHAASFAFVGDGLAVVTQDRDLTYWADGRLETVARLPFLQAHVRPTLNRNRLLIYQGPEGFGSGSDDDEMLYSLAPGGKLEALCGSPLPILAAAGDDFTTLFSVGGCLFQVVGPGYPTLVVALPEASERIVGIAVSGQTIYFSAPQKIYAVQGGVALPLVIGIGGPLRLTPDGLFVLDSTHHRVYRVTISPAPAAP